MNNKKIIQKPHIIQGAYKGKQLSVPPSARPITDRVKKTLFDVLGEVVDESRCLDLFAGSGSIGLEALSRGAKHVDFVESDAEAVVHLERNITNCFIQQDQYDIYEQDYLRFLGTRENLSATEGYDLVFIDPPFKSLSGVLLDELTRATQSNAIIVVKIESDTEVRSLQKNFIEIDRRIIGRNTLIFCRK